MKTLDILRFSGDPLVPLHRRGKDILTYLLHGAESFLRS